MKNIHLISSFLVVALLIQNLSRAAEDLDFQTSLKRLESSRRNTQQRLQRLGIRSAPFSKNFGFLNETEEENNTPRTKALYVLHDDLKYLRATAGKILFGKVYNRLIVGGENAPAIIELATNQGIFSGLRVLGKARPSGTQGRIAIDLDRIVTYKGTVIPIKGIAQDEAGGLGLEAEVFSSKALAVAGTLAASFISGLASSQQSQTPTAFGFSQIDRSGRNGVLQGISQTAADQSKRLLEEATQEKPVLVVDGGTSILIYLDEEVRF